MKKLISILLLCSTALFAMKKTEERTPESRLKKVFSLKKCDSFDLVALSPDGSKVAFTQEGVVSVLNLQNNKTSKAVSNKITYYGKIRPTAITFNMAGDSVLVGGHKDGIVVTYWLSEGDDGPYLEERNIFCNNEIGPIEQVEVKKAKSKEYKEQILCHGKNGSYLIESGPKDYLLHCKEETQKSWKKVKYFRNFLL